MSNSRENSIIQWTGERYVPWVDLVTPEIHYEHMHRYLFMLQFVEGKRVLDLASGEGYGCSILADKAAEVVGIDIDEEAVKHAASRYPLPNVNFLCGSITDIPIEGEKLFDVITCYEALEHIEDHDRLLSEVKRLLTDEGLFIVSTPNKLIYNKYSGGPNEFHLKELYFNEFKSLLNKNFSCVCLLGQKVFPVSSVWPLGESRGDFREFCVSKSELGFTPVGPQHKIPLYFMGIASQMPIERKDLFSALTDINEEMFNSFRNLINERDANITNLQISLNSKENLINEYEKVISSLRTEINEYERVVSSFRTEINEKDELLKKINESLEIKSNDVVQLEEVLENKEEYLSNNLTITQEMKDKIGILETDISEKDEDIKNHLEHINHLLEKDRRLNSILCSRGWKLLAFCYRTEDFILPPHSKRRLFLKLLYKSVKNPKKAILSLNMRNMQTFLSNIKKKDIDLLEEKISNRLNNHEENNFELKLFDQASDGKKIIFEKVDNPLVSIIIPVYNQWHFTYSCLLSIFENTEHVPYEVIIADDMSTDDTRYVSDYIENIVVVRNEKNLGFLLNCNNAAKYAKSKYILFLNNDTNVQKDWLKYLVELIEEDETIGMVGSKLVYPNSRLQEAGGIIWNDASGWNYGRLDDPGKPEYNYVKEVDYISGASLLIRIDLWKTIGGFDERYIPAYYEDTDLAFEVRKQGYKIVFQPKSVVVHFEGVSHGRDINTGLKSYQVENKKKFFSKWKDVLENHFLNGQEVFWARDRSKDKKTILIIDHYVPHYDKDAGSRLTYLYLKLFVESGLNVKFIGDNFYKHEPYTTDLEQLGIEVLYGSWYKDNYKNWMKDNCNKIDYIYLNRPHISIKYINFLKKNVSAKIIYHGHDLHYVRELERYKIENNLEYLKSAERWEKIENRLFENSDVIVTVSEKEKEIISNRHPSKKIITIPIFYYDSREVNKNNYNPKLRNNVMFVGGFNHSPNEDAVLWFTERILPIVLTEIPDLKFYIIGSNPPGKIRGLNSSNIIVKGYISDDELKELYSKVKMVVVPLRYGAGVKGKTIEAIYYGVPIVTTDFGIEGLPDIDEIIVPRNTENDFACELIENYLNDTKLSEISSKYTDYINNYFTKDIALGKVLSMLDR